MEFYAINESEATDHAGCRKLFEDTLIVLPSVSFGNVGQLAMDLLINTLLCKANADQEENNANDFQLVGHLFSTRVAPFAGSCAYSSSSNAAPLTLNLEVFQLKSRGITWIQQRTNVFPQQARAFAQELAGWAAASGAKGFCVLSGADDMLRHEDQPTASIHLQKITLKPLEQCDCKLLDQLKPCEANWQQDLRGIGITPLLFNCCQQRNEQLSFVAFVLFCAEGNNVPEAMQLAMVVLEFLRLWDIVDKDSSNQTREQHEVTRRVLGTTVGISMDEQHLLHQSALKTLVIPRSWAQLFGKQSDVSLFW